MGVLLQMGLSAVVASLPATKGVAIGLAGIAASLEGAKRLSRRRRGRKTRSGEEGVILEKCSSVKWAGVTCEYREKGGSERTILKDAVGIAEPGRMMAIMGPSGSGKTTLLSALAGQMPKSKKVTLSGAIACEGGRVAFVPQEDVFYSQLTVEETLRMAASFKLAEGTTEEQRERRVQEVMKALSLTQCAGTLVGDSKTRGISGGEKKRLSIGLELLRQSEVPILCDEPTTGLDSFQAEKVMRVLRQLANSGRTVIITIHQPKSSIFGLFDDVVLISQGLTVFSGAIADAKTFFVERSGIPLPEQTNLSEFFLDVISIDFDNEAETRGNLMKLVRNFRDDAAQVARVVGKGPSGRRRAQACHKNFWHSVKLLYLRSFRQVARDRATNILRLTTNLNSAIVFGSIYWRMKRTQSTIQDRQGLLQVVAINTAMSSITKTLTAFSREKVVVDRERTKGDYQIGAYLVAKLAAELPVSAVFPIVFGALVYPMCGLNKEVAKFGKFLSLLTFESFTSSAIGLSVGSIVNSPEAANALGPAVMVLFIVFGGYYCREENVPIAFRWIPKVSLIRHAFEGLTKNEFSGLKFETKQPTDVATGEAALTRLGFGESSVSKSLVGLGRIMLFNYMFTYGMLKERKPEFQQPVASS
ncbi:ABC transporter [Chloropicon primus]|uniref:ABC transporter n=2 Tax=Chloropicon primus TaxID=1764295 RepID=A0A5B8MWG1_9CHLO|nr:ABC transporter [Chloropicon primus]UPR03003.1 ABC transporter [Chloropicon primus]|eukprot:QDZ23790.1 ABC transporter [Chloropicon primus]